jgi:hypothetical protein
MAAKKEIKKDKYGLYTVCGGNIARPFYGTCFKEGDFVKTHHFSGSSRCGVTSLDKPDTHNFKKEGMYEKWCLSGISSTQYRNKELPTWYKGSLNFEEYLEQLFKWYERDSKMFFEVFKKFNEKFIK